MGEMTYIEAVTPHRNRVETKLLIEQQIDYIIKVTAKYFAVNPTLMKCDACRVRRLSDARHVAMYLAYKMVDVSKERISKSFCMTPQAAAYGFAKIERLLGEGKLQTEIMELTLFINSELHNVSK